MNSSIPAGRGITPTKEPPTHNNRKKLRREWKTHLLPPSQELELNGAEITQNKQLNKSEREASKNFIHTEELG